MRHLGDLLTTQLGVTVTAVGMATINDEIHVVISQDPVDGTTSPRTLHTIRHADGSWEPLRIVDREVLTPKYLSFNNLSCANVAGQLHICGVTDGTMLHTIRYPDGTWQNYWGDVSAAIQLAPLPNFGWTATFHCAGNAAGELHVIYLPGPRGARVSAFGAIRNPDGTWTAATAMDSFVVLESLVGSPGA